MQTSLSVQTCVGCGKSAPETETNYTLISAQFGWRLKRVKKADGSLTLEWRCPTCWRELKKTRSAEPQAEGAEPAHEPTATGVRTKGRPAPRTSGLESPDGSPVQRLDMGTPTRRPGRVS